MNAISNLSAAERRLLRSQAHALNPIVAISKHGLSPTVLQEIDRSLAAHELIKIRVLDGDREVREQLLAELCTALDAAPVQHIGKILVVWRKAPESDSGSTPPPVKKSRRNPPRLTKKAAAAAVTKATAKAGTVKIHAPRVTKEAVPRRRSRARAAQR